MASDNETVAEIREDVSEYLTSIGPSEYPAETEFEEFANRFVAAHKREIAEKDGERKGILKANKLLAVDNDRLRREVAEMKDTIDANLRVHKAAESADADAKLSLNGEIVKRDTLIAELRECLQLAVEMKCTNCGLCTRGLEPCYPEGQIVHHEDCLMIQRWRKALEAVK